MVDGATYPVRKKNYKAVKSGTIIFVWTSGTADFFVNTLNETNTHSTPIRNLLYKISSWQPKVWILNIKGRGRRQPCARKHLQHLNTKPRRSLCSCSIFWPYGKPELADPFHANNHDNNAGILNPGEPGQRGVECFQRGSSNKSSTSGSKSRWTGASWFYRKVPGRWKGIVIIIVNCNHHRQL